MTAGNIAFFPKVQSLVINTDAYEDLSDEQRTELREAAAATQTWAAEHDPDEATAARDYCASGGAVVLADSADVEAMVAATRRVYDELADDPLTDDLIADIEAVTASASPDPPVLACAGTPAPSPTATSGAGDGGSFPEGVYRMEITAEELVAAGAEPAWAGDVAGMWTMTFADGVLTMVDVNARSGLRIEVPGTYCVTQGRVSIDIFGDPDVCGDGEYFSAGWRRDGDDLRFLEVRASDEEQADVNALYGEPVWRRIG